MKWFPKLWQSFLSKEDAVMKKLLIKNASEVVTCKGKAPKRGKEMSELGILENGSVLVSDGIIEDVGTFEEIAKRNDISDAEVIDAVGRALLPGFIDCHTHLIFGGYRADEFNWRLKGMSYMEIMEKGGGIVNSVEATRSATKEELINEAKKRLSSMLSFGVTTCEAKSGYGLDFDNEIKQLEVIRELNKLQDVELVATYLGAHSIPKEYKKEESGKYIDFIIEKMLPYIKEHDLAKFVDIFVEKNVFSVEEGEKLLSAAKEMGFKTKVHADEIVTLGGAELAAKMGSVSAEHLLHISDKGIEDMAEKGVIADVLPCTAFNLKEPYAPARKMIDAGCAVAVATDFNPGSCFCENISLAFLLSVLNMGMTVEEAVNAITINAASSICMEDRIGSIEKGKQADFVLLEFPSYTYLPYHLGTSSIEKVIKKGRVVFER